MIGDIAPPRTQMPSLLSKLGKMTSIRDTALLEQSLLKTLCPMLGVLDSSLYRVDDAHEPARVLHHHRSRVVEESGQARLVERTEDVQNELKLTAEVSALLDNVRLLNKPCTRKVSASDFMVAYPLYGGREICGFFVFVRDREVSLTEDAIVKGILEVFSNYYELLDASQRDRLTGLLNRQALENSFERIWAVLSHPQESLAAPGGRREPHGSAPHWLGVIDIDHFKQVNDRFGHVLGDEVLLQASRLMACQLRSSDLMFRFGGEEFVVVLQAEDADACRAVLERVRSAVESHFFPQVGNVTVSAGFSLADPNALPQQVLSWADLALYQAKKAGRNMVCDYQALLQQGVIKAPDSIEPELF